MDHSQKKNEKLKRNRFCSWCFKKTDYRLKEEHMFGRDMYECLSCFGNGCECISCEGMARRYDDKSADKLCFKCDPRFTNEDEESLNEMGWCSWCLLHTAQILVQPSIITRNVYKCGHCHRRTLSCRSCREGFVRGHGSYDDQLCLKCDGTIEHWHERELNFQKLSQPGWCSWCLDYSRHSLEQVNKVRRSVYTCIQCQNRTLPCNSCNIGMTRGGAGWDDDHCSACDKEYSNQGKNHAALFEKATLTEMPPDVQKLHEKLSDVEKKYLEKWLLMQARKDIMVKQPRTEELVRKEMAKESQFRELAAKSGMIRPFLILVAMPAFFRNKVANFLGWTLFTQPYFGDAHEEAWVILSKDMSGMMPRAIKAYERIALLNRMPWYNVVYRVTQEIFRRVDAPEIDFDDAVKMSNLRNNDYMKNIEQEFLLKLGALQQRTAQMPDQVPKTQAEIEADEIIRERVIKNAGINRPEVLNYAVRLTKTIVGAPGQLTIAVFAINTATTILPALSGVAVPITSAAALVTTPLFILGIFSLIKDAITLGLGSSEGRLFGPLMVIMNQKILLAVEGIDIEDFMP